MRVHVINAREQSPAKIGIDLITILAFPSATEDKRRQGVARKLHENYLRELGNQSPEDGIVLRQLYASVFGSRTETHALTRRLAESMQIGTITLALLKEPITGSKPLLPPGVTRLSVKHDDQVDATSQALAHLFARVGPDAWMLEAREHLSRQAEKDIPTFRVNHPDGGRQFQLINGRVPRRGADGSFHVTAEELAPLRRVAGIIIG